MKSTISTEKIKETIIKKRELIIVIFSIIFVAGMTFASYKAINPGVNNEAMKQGEAQLENLNVNFDDKTLKELKEEKAPSVINGTAGRNPFTPL